MASVTPSSWSWSSRTELAIRADRHSQLRVKAAQFRELKRLEEFDWWLNPSIKRKQIYDLASGRFIRKSRDVLFLGPPGVGESFLPQALRSGEDRTVIELFVAGARSWEADLRRQVEAG